MGHPRHAGDGRKTDDRRDDLGAGAPAMLKRALLSRQESEEDCLSFPSSVADCLGLLTDSHDSEGHRVMAIGNGHGSCVSLADPDELDRAALRYAMTMARGNDTTALDLGCSPYMPQALRLAAAGLHVTAVDLAPSAIPLDQLGFAGHRIRYVRSALRHPSWGAILCGERPSIIYAHRCLSHVPYHATCELLANLATRAAPSARFFLSFSGLSSTLAMNYPCREVARDGALLLFQSAQSAPELANCSALPLLGG